MTEEEKRKRRCGFTGHRPQKLERDITEIKIEIFQKVKESVESGFYTFISGMAPGTDIISAECVLKLKEKYPDIHLICAIPFPTFENLFNDEWKARYKAVKQNADLIRYISTEYSYNCFQKRNMWIVDHTAKLIAVYNGTPGGTRNTIEYSIKKGVKIDYIKG